MGLYSTNNKNNKRGSSADGFSLLPSALEPRLFKAINIKLNILGISIITILTTIFINLVIISSPSFAIDSCLDSTTPCLNVSIVGSISLDLKPVSSTGTFATSSTTDNTVSVMTNYFAGYTLSIAASTANDNALKYKENDEVLATIPSHTITAGVSATNYQDDTYARANELNNTWGYRPSKYNSVDNTTTNYYYPGPTSTINTTPTILDSTTTANPETANNYNIAIGARVGTDIPKGTYTNTFIMQVVANPVPYTIAFDKGNAEAEAVSNLPTTLNSSTRDATVTLPNIIPTRTGRKFLGWCITIPTETDNVDSCSGTTYNPNGDGTDLAYTISQTTSNANITLYAMWRPPMVTWENNYSGTNLPANETTIINGPITTLPTPTKPSTQCNGVDCFASFKEWNTKADGTGDAVIAGVAPTDETTYYAIWNFNSNTLQATRNVATAEDGTNCAGTKYDARDGKAYNVNYITSGSSNFCFILSNLKVDKGVTLKSGDSDITPNSKYSTFTTPTETWSGSGQNYYCEAIMAEAGGEYYYNWYAVKANPYQCESPTSSTNATTTNDGYSLGSICPVGWKLPEDGFSELQINNSTFRTALVNNGSLATTGYFLSGSQNDVGSYGYWWSSTWGDNYSAFRLNFDGSSVARRLSNRKYFGFSVRCLRSN